MNDFYRQAETPFDRAVDSAINAENERYINSPEGRAAMQRHSDNVKRWAEAALRKRGAIPCQDHPDREAVTSVLTRAGAIDACRECALDLGCDPADLEA